jgi:Raf kinase inhibitor-like YbhB/YbcL family protein
MTAPRDDSTTRRFALASAAFRDGERVPVRHTCDGEDLSPSLAWTGVPVETRSFALICDDPDAPRGTWVHWLIWNLPADTAELKEGVPPTPELKSGARQGLNDGSKVGYGGPCPPPGKPHRYFFRLYALDTMLNLPTGVRRAELDAAIGGHILSQAAVMGTYERRKG